MITINAIIQAKQGQEEALFMELKKVVEPSREETGCVEYTLHQSLDEDGTFVFYETWEDEAALKAHVESEHYKAYRQATSELTDSRTVHKLRKV
ncbi:antibiotic biosynthesis monooxygenase [Halobacillus litoralis]|uniref:Antibiotic biosynthesis monooxygenase n=1 Tax=Halobacillus litoralis TaxID=45668 RepID=A0A845E8M7_9BACI|nr:putative quinol monooxygenase [Halobacillus litoralis]MYL48121.1 antibiotic biosynthesis monooxygenase [Halobacillus litoralis]